MRSVRSKGAVFPAPKPRMVKWAACLTVPIVLITDALPLGVGPVVANVLRFKTSMRAAAVAIEVNVYGALGYVGVGLSL